MPPLWPSPIWNCRHAFTSLLIWLGTACAHSQTPPDSSEHVSQTWTIEDGLPHNRISHIVQDRAGFVWAGTQAGLTRFDGRTFKDFPLPQPAETGLAIRSFAAAGPNRLAVIPAADQILDFHDGVFRPHPLSPHVKGLTPIDIFAEPNGTLWVGTLEGKLFRWENGDVQTFDEADGIDPREPSFSFAIDGEGRTWIATGNFLGCYRERRLLPFDQPLERVVTIAPARSGGIWLLVRGALKKLEGGRLTTILADPPWIRLSASVRHLFEDREGCLWIAATGHGLFRFRDGQLTHPALPAATVQAIMEDREGNLWLGTRAEGLGILRRKHFRSFDAAAGLPQKLSTSVCEDSLGNIWFANGKGGLVRQQGGKLQQIAFPTDVLEVITVCPDHRGHLWVGTARGLYRISQSDPTVVEKIDQPIPRVASLFVARNGDLWIAGNLRNTGTLGILRGTSFQPVTFSARPGAIIKAISEDPAGNVWLASDIEGLQVFRQGRVAPPPAGAGLPTQVNTAYFDRSGVLWIGTNDGLFRFENGRLQSFREAEGLRDHIILQMLEDDVGQLWIGSRKGLFYVSLGELRAVGEGRLRRVNSHAFGKDEGLPAVFPVTGVQPAAWRDHAGRLWFATHHGVISVDPTALPASSPTVSAFIDEVRIDDRSVDAARTITIPPGRHRLEFRFVAPSFTSPGNVRLRYQLEGIDRDWLETEAGSAISYAGLPPGNYRLRAAAMNGNGESSEHEAVLAVAVTPAWWQRNGVRALAAISALSALVLLVRFASQVKLRRRLASVEKDRSLDEERTRIARDVHDELGGAVTSVRFLVSRLKSDPAAASLSRVVERLTAQTQQLAFDLERVVWMVHPKSNSLDQLVAFIERFAHNLFQGSAVRPEVRCHTEIPACPMAPGTQHHVLAFAKEALTNILKHAQATEVGVETSYSGGAFTLAIRDNGVGFDPAAGHSERNGLANMRSRAAEIGGRIEFQSSPQAGTTVVLSVPIASPIASSPHPAF